MGSCEIYSWARLPAGEEKKSFLFLVLFDFIRGQRFTKSYGLICVKG